MRRRLVTGVADSMIASLATFLIGAYAARQLDLTELGAYGLLFAVSLVIASGVMAQGYHLPIEVLLQKVE